jgi:hypothetical protein
MPALFKTEQQQQKVGIGTVNTIQSVAAKV